MSTRAKALSLFDLLACPTCKTAVTREDEQLRCAACGQRYPIVDNVPILFPDGRMPEFQHQHELMIRGNYLPWIERLVMQSLPPGAIVLDIGAGNRAFNLPHVIRMDVTKTPFADVVGDSHALPFLPGAFDFIFSLAVIEHLRQPFVAAQEMAAALRPGGYVYGECNFVFPYHGFPHHYFNASEQGLEEVFAPFTRLRSGVAPYQMPSFAVRSILSAYRNALERIAETESAEFRQLLDRVCDSPLRAFDEKFPEGEAVRLAAGVFFFGVKLSDGPSDVLPPAVLQAWQRSADLQQRFPNPLDLGHVDNLMLWAKAAGRDADPAIAAWFSAAQTFRKTADMDDADRRVFELEPVREPAYGRVSEADASERAPSDAAPPGHRNPIAGLMGRFRKSRS
jgi:uncharacterized protein YbaR (Trm112 family)